MQNIRLTQGTVNDIDKQVSKVLCGLGNPDPPLDLEAVFQLLKLDPQYYSTSEDGVIRETISRVKVGAQLVFQNPTRIWDAIKKLDLKALYIPEQRRVLIDASLHEKKKRWNGAHEIGHSILEWHQDYTWGDTHVTLSQACHEQIEAEANYTAGRLLFMQEHFEQRVKGMRHSLKGLGEIAKIFGNSWTSTLYRAVEMLDTPAFAIIGSHPMKGGDERFRYLVSSPSFAERFSQFNESAADQVFGIYCGHNSKGPLGETEFMLTDDQGDTYRFTIESFALPQGDVLTLAQFSGKASVFHSIGASN